MDPQTQQLDPQVVNLAKAIRQVESGGNFQAQGKSGEFGAYQFMPDTWKTWAPRYLGANIPIEQSTPQQQNEVAYKKIKELKDQGYNVGQIASVWNSGDPNKYTQNVQGTNSAGVHYDVPAYAKSVATAYQTLKNGGSVSVDPQNPSSVGYSGASQDNSQTVPSQEQSSLGDKVLHGAGVVGDFLFPIVKDIYRDVKGTSDKNILQQTADLGLSVLTVVPFLGEASVGARGAQIGAKAAEAAVEGGIIEKFLGSAITKGVGYGAAAGTLGAISEGKDLKGVAKGGAIGGVLGGALGVAGNLVEAAAKWFPQRIARSFIPGINEETAAYAVSKGLGSPQGMLAESENAIKSLGKTLGEELKNPSFSGISVNAQELLPGVVKQFPNAGLTIESLGQKLMQVAPNQKTLIERLISGEGLALDELHKLNSEIGSNVFKTVFDNPEVKAGKAIASAFYHEASQALKTKAPASSQLFDDLAREYPLRKALERAVRSGRKASMLSLKDILAFMAGLPAGIGGALGSLALEKVATSPRVNLGVAGVVAKAAQSQAPKIGGMLGTILATRRAGAR